MSTKPIVVALVGNPNTGKSTLFNALSGLRQHVGNYPGVTVELKKGTFQFAGRTVELIDLPGTYSLAPRSLDEAVAVDLLLGRLENEAAPDVVLSIVDASNLDRQLYLTTQVMELGIPVVLAVNMLDVAAKQGLAIDLGILAERTGLSVVPIQANRGIGLDDLRKALVAAPGSKAPSPPAMPADVDSAAAELVVGIVPAIPGFLSRRLLFDIGGSTESWFLATHGDRHRPAIDAARERLKAAGLAVPGVEAKARYGFIRPITAAAVRKPERRPTTWTDRFDRALTHKLWGTLIFLILMFGVFASIFWLAEPPKGWIEAGIETISSWIESQLSVGPLRSLLVDGLIAGVGGVLVFLPQILILFLFIAILEDCGYMARAAFLMDKLMSRCGLSGKSFIPLLSSVACAVPGIMATRVIENRWDRLATILVAPLMSCSARLPVYTLMIGLFLPAEQYGVFARAAVLFAMYMIGFVAAPVVALLLRKTLLRGGRSMLIMELPGMKVPSAKTVIIRVFDAGWAFVKRAGTIILASMVLIWASLYFPSSDADGANYEARIAEHLEKDEKGEARKLKAEWKRQSYLGRLGQWMEPVFRPLGWDWRLGMATLASFPAREVIVGTMTMLYEVEEGDDDEQTTGALTDAIRDDWNAGPRSREAVPIALSVMVFFALCCQCASTLAVIRRETKSWRWPIFTFFYMTGLAYLAALAVYQIGRLFVGD